MCDHLIHFSHDNTVVTDAAVGKNVSHGTHALHNAGRQFASARWPLTCLLSVL